MSMYGSVITNLYRRYGNIDEKEIERGINCAIGIFDNSYDATRPKY